MVNTFRECTICLKHWRFFSCKVVHSRYDAISKTFETNYELIYQLNAIEYFLHSIYQLFIYLFILTTYLQDTICCICKEIVTTIAPEDGRVSPKHFELKVHNKYSIALSW